MKKAILIFIMIIPCVLSNTQENAGWEELFNGKNLKGWIVLNGTAEFKVGTESGQDWNDGPPYVFHRCRLCGPFRFSCDVLGFWCSDSEDRKNYHGAP